MHSPNATPVSFFTLELCFKTIAAKCYEPLINVHARYCSRAAGISLAVYTSHMPLQIPEQVFGFTPNEVMAYAAIAQTVLALVLAAVTGYYAWRARGQTKASREQVASSNRQPARVTTRWKM